MIVSKGMYVGQFRDLEDSMGVITFRSGNLKSLAVWLEHVDAELFAHELSSQPAVHDVKVVSIAAYPNNTAGKVPDAILDIARSSHCTASILAAGTVRKVQVFLVHESSFRKGDVKRTPIAPRVQVAKCKSVGRTLPAGCISGGVPYMNQDAL